MADVTLTKLVKAFGDIEIIHGVDLQIKSGEFAVFVGPSGCGKSTLLRLIAGLEDVTSGKIEIAGNDVTDVDAAKRGIAMVFQSYALYPHMTVRENLGFGLKMNGVDKSIIKEKSDHAAGILQLDKYMDRKPKDLSGGQRQRVAIGRAIVRNPDVFLFDEPLSNLDAELRVEMRLEIGKLHQKLGNTMIYVTHDQVEAMTMADRIVVLKDGYVEQHGSPLELYTHPDNLFVAGFIGSPRMNFIPVTLEAAGVETSSIKLPDGQVISLNFDTSGAKAGDSLTLGLRPEDLSGSEGDFNFELKVILSEHLGGTSYLYGEYGQNDNFVVERPGNDRTRSGESVAVYADAKSAYLFGSDGQAFKRDVEM
jgi:ABC-type sugar transport system ATPase subunit